MAPRDPGKHGSATTPRDGALTSGSSRREGRAWFTTHQVAQLFGVTLPTVAGWADKGLLVATRTPGGHRRIARADLLAFARDRGVTLPPEIVGTGFAARVLVIDDEADFAELVREYLRVKGALEVAVAHSGFVAGYLLAAFQPEVIVLDLAMPDLDGHELRRALAESPALRGVPIVATASYRDAHLDARIREERFAGFVEKPVKLDNLLDIVREALGVLDE